MRQANSSKVGAKNKMAILKKVAPLKIAKSLGKLNWFAGWPTKKATAVTNKMTKGIIKRMVNQCLDFINLTLKTQCLKSSFNALVLEP